MKGKIGMTQWSLPCKLADSVKMTAELGLAAVQIDLGPASRGYTLTDDALRASLMEDSAKTGVEIASVVLNDLCSNGFVHPEGDPKRDIAYRTLKTGVEITAKMNVKTICMPSFFDNEIRSEAEYKNTVAALQYICDLAAEHGIEIYTENVMEPDALKKLFRDVDRENLRLLFDSQNYHFMAGVDCVPVYESAKPWITRFLHVKDGTTALGHIPLGEGNSDFMRTLRALVKGGFDGVYVLENKYDDLDAARKEIENLKKMIETIEKE